MANSSLRFKGRKSQTASSEGVGPKMYPAEDAVTPKMRWRVNKPTKLRSSIVPGTVLILLAGRFRGKRVVFLKQLSSGTLLVSGPYKVNGVPLRRVNQAYVIATSVVVDLSKVTVPDIDDTFFARKGEDAKTDEEQFFSTEAKPAVVSDERKAAQKAVDAGLMKAIGAVPMLRAYLGARFSLRNGDKPHLMKF